MILTFHLSWTRFPEFQQDSVKADQGFMARKNNNRIYKVVIFTQINNLSSILLSNDHHENTL